MKITAVTPWLIKADWDERPGGDLPRNPTIREFLFVQVETDAGITGWGEITPFPGQVGNRAMHGFVKEVGALVIGEDPSDIDYIWHKLFRRMTYVGSRGATTAAISAIDIALWDIRGKELGQPIYKLLGGAVRDKIGLYCHPPEPKDPVSAAIDAKEIVASGHRAFKFDPFMRSLPEGNAWYIDGQISKRGEEEAVEITAAIREAVGPETELLIDAHAMFNVPTAVRLAQRLEPFDILWFEEPCPPESYHALKQVKDQIPQKISVGERLYTRWEFIPILEQELADYIMPDVTWTGGITELKKIANLAEAYYVPLSPHDAAGPINVIAGAQVCMNVPNFYKLETNKYDLSNYNPFIDHPLDIREGDLYVSDRPGLGLEIDLDYLKAHALEGYGG